MNVVILMGRMTRDPELKFTSGGKVFANFSLAVQKKKDEVEYIDCTVWEKTAETIAEYFRKGNRILVQGRLSVNSYEQNGEKRRKMNVVVNSFEFVESSKSSGNSEGYQQNKSFSNNNSKPVQNDTFDDDNDDMEDDEEFPF